MKQLLLITYTIACLSLTSSASVKDIYIVFYATCKGKTGHMGIAVDNYKYVYKQKQVRNKTVEYEDTLTTGEFTYFDIWPNEDDFNATKTSKNIPAVYYKLPTSTLGEAITINSLFDKGITHKEHYACDGLLRIKTNSIQDQWFTMILDSMVEANKPFNGRQFNCADFVRIPLEMFFKQPLKSKEFVLAGWSTTPNKLYRTLRKRKEIEVIKNADEKAAGAFIVQRIFYNMFNSLKNIINY
jgi:hypothetical protein